jgi:hypothetical protein
VQGLIAAAVLGDAAGWLGAAYGCLVAVLVLLRVRAFWYFLVGVSIVSIPINLLIGERWWVTVVAVIDVVLLLWPSTRTFFGKKLKMTDDTAIAGRQG